MRYGLVYIAIVCIPLLAVGQTSVKIDIVALADKLPPPPADAKEAYNRSECPDDPSGASCNCDKFYQVLSDELSNISTKLADATSAEDQPMTDKMKKVDAEAVQKKMATMSQDEKMQYAMELSKQMGMGPKVMSPEPPAVTSAIQECTKVNMAMSGDFQKSGDVLKNRAAMNEDREKKHREIVDWQQAEEQKLPQVSGGEMSAPEPKAYRALMLKSADKHLAVEAAYLKNVRSSWQDDLMAYKGRYSTLQQKLVAIHYGDDAKNSQNRRVLLSAQMLMLTPLKDLLDRSKGATNDASGWYAQKLKTEHLETK